MNFVEHAQRKDITKMTVKIKDNLPYSMIMLWVFCSGARPLNVWKNVQLKVIACLPQAFFDVIDW